MRRVGENLPAASTRASSRRQSIARTGSRGRPIQGRPAFQARRDPIFSARCASATTSWRWSHFWRTGRAVRSRATLAPETVAALTRDDWPGNVRELRMPWLPSPSMVRAGAGSRPATCHIKWRGRSIEPAPFEAAREAFERRFVRALARAAVSGARRTSAWSLASGIGEDVEERESGRSGGRKL